MIYYKTGGKYAMMGENKSSLAVKEGKIETG